MPPSRLARLDSRALIRLAGDWRPFLHNLLTHDVESLAPGQLRFAALLTPQGRVLHDIFVHAGADEGWLETGADQRDALLQRLTLYRLRAKVTIEPAPGAAWALFSSAQPLEGEGPDVPSWSVDPRLPDLGFRAAAAEPPPARDAVPATEDDYDACRLRLGVPDPARDRTPSTYPIEANWDLLNGIDFRKGCFIGQETTSRMKRRGQIKTRTLPIVFDGRPPPFGAEVLAGDLRAGEVLTGLGGRAMALLRLDRIEGAALTVDGRPVRVDRPAWFPPA